MKWLAILLILLVILAALTLGADCGSDGVCGMG
jgi:hypothetical protein